MMSLDSNRWVSVEKMSSDKDGGVKIEKNKLSSERRIKLKSTDLFSTYPLGQISKKMRKYECISE